MKEAIAFWKRALQTLAAAVALLDMDSDSAASRAYYAAFYAVSAAFAAEGKRYKRHSGVESAVHRDLVGRGLFSPELGGAYSSLRGIRMIGDYGVQSHVLPEDAEDAVGKAREVLYAVHRLDPANFAWPDSTETPSL